MEFDQRARGSQAGPAKVGVAAGSAGKRTLSEQLPVGAGTATTAIQRKQDPAAATTTSGRAPGGGDDRGGGDQPAPLTPAGAAINDLLLSYQNIAVEVPVPDPSAPRGQEWATTTRRTPAHAKIPYWNNRYVAPGDAEALEPPAGFDLSARQAALGALGIDGHTAVAVGKGRPDEIAAAVTGAIALGLIAPPGCATVSADDYWATAWRAPIEAWLLRVGIGLDCSGFVYQALDAARDATDAAPTGNGVFVSYPNVDSSRTYVSDEQMGALGELVNPPDDLEPAVIMFIEPDGGHIRIITQVDRSQRDSGITEFTTAESTADGQRSPEGANGPRVHAWRYNQNALEHRYEGSAEWLASSEQPVYRRHLIVPAASTASTARGGASRNVQLKATGTGPGAAATTAAAGPGAPLPEPTRLRMERSFGVGLTSVRVHEGDAAPALGASAYAEGEGLHFAPGRYQPGSPDGDALIGHEVAHVVQQRAGRVAAPQGKGAPIVDDAALEAEADRMGEAAAAGRPAAARGTGGAPHTAATAGHAMQRQAVRDSSCGGGEAQAGEGFDGLLATIDGILTRRTADSPIPVDLLRPPAGELTAWCRAHLPDQDQVRSFLQSKASRDDKIRTLGDLGNELARMELMLGGLYNGAASGASWRADAGSASLFPAAYLDAAGGLPADADWCTAFASFGFGRLGADSSVTNAAGSGPKQREHGAVVFPQDSWVLLRHLIAYWQVDAGHRGGIASLADLVCQFLHDAPGVLDQIDPANPGNRTPFEQYLYDVGAASRVVTSMTSRTVPTSVPRIGDLLILNTQGPASGTNDDHTAMIDRFRFPVLSTIEGNLGNTTGSRQLDLTNPEQIAQIYFISRPAQQIVDAQPAATGAGNPGAGLAALLALRSHNERIHAAFIKLSGTATAAYSAPAHDWIG
jgi:hypothetical protein